MKRKIALLFVMILLSVLFTSCQEVKTATPCAKCGADATTTLTGPLEYLLEEGVPRSECQLITQGIYSAPLCDSCIVSPIADTGFY